MELTNDSATHNDGKESNEVKLTTPTQGQPEVVTPLISDSNVAGADAGAQVATPELQDLNTKTETHVTLGAVP